MKLYDMKDAPNPRRVRVFLAEKGIEIEKVQVDIMNGENLKDEYLAINPRGVLPTLQLEDDSIIDETAAICRYIEELQPNPPLLGSTPKSRASVEAWIRQIEADALIPAADILRNTNSIFENRSVPGTSDTPQIPELAHRGEKRLHSFYTRLNQRLKESTYIGDNSFTAADITAMCAIDFAEFVGIGVPDNLDHITKWRERVSSRPSASA